MIPALIFLAMFSAGLAASLLVIRPSWMVRPERPSESEYAAFLLALGHVISVGGCVPHGTASHGPDRPSSTSLHAAGLDAPAAPIRQPQVA